MQSIRLPSSLARLFVFPVGLSLVLSAAACTTAGEDDAGATPEEEVDGGEPDANPEVDAGPIVRPADCPVGTPFVHQIRGSVFDEDDVAAIGGKAQMCVRTYSGQFLCLQPSDIAQDGSFVINVPETARCMLRATTRVLVPAADSATVYCPVNLDGADGAVEVETAYVIVDTIRPPSIPPIGDDTVARDVEFESGLTLNVVPDDVYGQDYENLAARVLDANGAQPCAIAEAPVTFDGFVAFSPEGDLPENLGVGAKIPVTGLAAGTSVDIYVQGGLLCTLDDGTALEEAMWGRVGTTTVDPTGTFIDVTGDITVPCLNWLGWVVNP